MTVVDQNILSVREAGENDLERIVDYFCNADKDFLLGMGVEPLKLPQKDEWLKLLFHESQRCLMNKKIFYVVWLFNNIPVGHSNINKIIWSEEAYMHIHMWDSSNRQNGIGVKFIELSLPHFFDNFVLKRLYCEPYALNPSPNKTLKKIGFEFLREYVTIPGWIQFEQPVNLWVLSYDRFVKRNKI